MATAGAKDRQPYPSSPKSSSPRSQPPRRGCPATWDRRVFIVQIWYAGTDHASSGVVAQSRILWDRKIDGGFPEAKGLKRRVRDVIDPRATWAHVDRGHSSLLNLTTPA